MAENFLVLGQVDPLATTNTDMYTVPAAKKAIISAIFVANRGGGATTFRIAIRPGGAAISNEQYVYYDMALNANETLEVGKGLTLDETDVITVYTAVATVSFSVYGTEVDETTPGIVSPEVDTKAIAMFSAASTVWTNMPLAETEFLGSRHRARLDLTQMGEVRIIVDRNTGNGAAASVIRGQYSTDGLSWNAFDGGTEPQVNIATASNTSASSWITMNIASQADVYLRIVGVNGDGVLDPTFTKIILEFR